MLQQQMQVWGHQKMRLTATTEQTMPTQSQGLALPDADKVVGLTKQAVHVSVQ